MRGLVIFLLAIQIWQVGCASIGGSRQFVKISADVDQAEVLDENGSSLGTAPGFIAIERSYSRQLKVSADFDSKKESKTLALEGSYRWGTSLVANLLSGLLITPVGSAVGLVIDFATGAAWNYDRAKRISFYGDDKPKPLLPKSIVVAPPRYADEVISDEIGHELKLLVQERYPKTKVYGYEDKIEIFNAYDTSFERNVDRDFRDELYREIGTTHYARSQIRRAGNRITVKTQIVDVLRDEVVDSFDSSVPVKELISKPDSTWSTPRRLLVGLLPNSIGVQSTGGILYFSGTAEGNPRWEFRTERTSASGVLGSSYNISISNVVGRRARPIFGFGFRFVPSLTFKWEQFAIRYSEPISSQLQTRNWSLYQFGLGIGPEVGLYTPIGYLYLNYVPELAAYWVEGGSSFDEQAISSKIGTGLSFFFSDRWHGRFFGALQSYPNRAFERMIKRDLAAPNLTGNDIWDFSVGLAFEYVFPEARKSVIREL